MNILIPHQWLLEHLDVEKTLTPTDFQAKISLCGPSIERIYERQGDSVYDIEVTTNRVDSMSIRGIAREAAVILEQFGIPARLKPINHPQPSNPAPDELLPLPKITSKNASYRRIMCIVLSHVQHTATPAWMATRLEQTDQHVHDAIIDITNYITHELGHPCHAFDYDKIMKLGGEISITEADKGEKFTTLDGMQYQTLGSEIVYKNPAGEIIDLPAIKGTANTAIDDTTTNVLFWIESLDAKKVRFASMGHAIRTVAAQLNEKHVDPYLAENVFYRGIELYQQLCGAKIASEMYDDFPAKTQTTHSVVALSVFEQYLGIKLPATTITAILEKLGCKVDLQQDNKLSIQPPSYRPDLEIPADYVEEVARIYGYHQLPSQLMATAIPISPQTNTNFAIERRVKELLADLGMQEIYSYSMVSEATAKNSGFSLDQHLRIANPLSDDHVFMRQSVVPSLENIIIDNKQLPLLEVYELAHTYHPVENKLPQQILRLGMVGTSDYRAFKGKIEQLLRSFYCKNLTVISDKQAGTGFVQSGQLVVHNVSIGTIGIIASGRAAAEIEFSRLLTVIAKHPRYQPIHKIPPVVEDLTFTLKEKTEIGRLIQAIIDLDPVFTEVLLKDQYQQNFTFTITYQSKDTALETNDVSLLRKKIVETLAQQFQATLVGELT